MQESADATIKVKLPSRGRSYPRETLKKCIEFVDEIRKRCGAENISYDVLEKAMGVQKRSSTFEKRFAASRQFNLIDFNVNKVSLTILAKSILFPVSEDAKRKALMDAFKSPPLYKEIIEKYNGVILPSSLPNILYLDFKLAEGAKEDAADIFITSGKYAGVINGENRLSTELLDFAASTTDNKGPAIEAIPDPVSRQLPQKDTQPLQDFDDTGQSFTLKFSSGRYAKIFIPDGFTKKDLTKLIYQINVLRFDLDEQEGSSIISDIEEEAI